MARLSKELVTECVLGALAKAGGAALPEDWTSLESDARAEAPLDASKLTPRGRDELIHAIRNGLRTYAAYCPIDPTVLDKSGTVADLVAYVQASHQPIP